MTTSQNNDAVTRPRHSGVTSDSKLTNNDSKLIDTNTKVLVEAEKPKKKNLYEKCIDIINEFTDDTDIRELLVLYLKMRLEMKDKPLYANQFKGILNKIREYTESKDRAKEIIQYSIDHSYATFYDFDKNYGKKQNAISNATCNHNVESVSLTKEDIERIEQRKKEGRQVVF